MGDIANKESLVKGTHGCDWLVHFASSFEFWVPDQRIYYEVNLDGVRNVMESAFETGIQKVIHVSTAVVYCSGSWPINEESPYGLYRPSRYAQTKFEGDMIAWKLKNVLNPFGWGPVALNLVLAAGYGFFQFFRSASRYVASAPTLRCISKMPLYIGYQFYRSSTYTSCNECL